MKSFNIASTLYGNVPYNEETLSAGREIFKGNIINLKINSTGYCKESYETQRYLPL